METKTSLLEGAKDILEQNDHGEWTQPTAGLYPHQWLWDSCFVAIGISHFDPERASRELLSLFRGSWRNGMLPHIIFSNNRKYSYGPSFWNSKNHQKSPENIETSGITQPPMIAIAAVEVGEKMVQRDRHKFFRKIYSELLAYHEWIYNERDPDDSGLTVLLHPWETGLDNTPPWMEIMSQVKDEKTEHRRVDTDFVSSEERPTDKEHKALVSLALLHKRLGYDSKKIIQESPIVIQDLSFNSLLIAANDALCQIAQEIGRQIPKKLHTKFRQTKVAINQLWDEETGQFYSRNLRTGNLLKIATSSTFLPLYSGTISRQQKKKLLALLFDPKKYWTEYPVPTVPIDSPYFKERCYWQGPVWANMNWFIARALNREKRGEEARYLLKKTKELAKQSNFREYYSSLDGSGCGGENFSWTAALFIDLTLNKQLRYVLVEK